jgi:hypothetical protein
MASKLQPSFAELLFACLPLSKKPVRPVVSIPARLDPITLKPRDPVAELLEYNFYHPRPRVTYQFPSPCEAEGCDGCNSARCDCSCHIEKDKDKL